jgi:hypothetical protein
MKQTQNKVESLERAHGNRMNNERAQSIKSRLEEEPECLGGWGSEIFT